MFVSSRTFYNFIICFNIFEGNLILFRANFSCVCILYSRISLRRLYLRVQYASRSPFNTVIYFSKIFKISLFDLYFNIFGGLLIPFPRELQLCYILFSRISLPGLFFKVQFVPRSPFNTVIYFSTTFKISCL